MKNNLLIGFVLGLIFPVLAFVLTKHTDIQMQLFPDKPTGLYVIAGAINLMSCYVCYKKGLDKVGNGFVLATFLGMLLMVFSKTLFIPTE